MDHQCLVLNDVVREELLKFGTWYIEECCENTDVMSALFRYGYCLSQISLSVAKAVMHDTSGNLPPWTREYGLSPKIITALLETLGLPTNHTSRLDLHIISASRPFRVHSAYHDPSKSMVPFTCHMNAGECHEATNLFNQCTMARANQRLLWLLDSKHKQREQRVLKARREFVQQRNKLEEERKRKFEEWKLENNFGLKSSKIFSTLKIISVASIVLASIYFLFY